MRVRVHIERHLQQTVVDDYGLLCGKRVEEGPGNIVVNTRPLDL